MTGAGAGAAFSSVSHAAAGAGAGAGAWGETGAGSFFIGYGCSMRVTHEARGARREAGGAA